MLESQPTVHGKRPTGMLEPRPFGVEDRPPCPSCGAEMRLFSRSPEPGHHAYEVQMFSCMKCDAEITQSTGRNGKPHRPTILIELECASRAPQCRAKCKAAAAINQSLDLFVSLDYASCMNDEESAQRMPRRAAWVRPPLPLS